MASTEPNSPGRQPISPQKRQLLQSWFQHGSKSAGKGDFEYATEMFTQCVQGDPGNPLYVQNFLGTLQKKYNNNKTGGKLSGLRGAGAKGSLTKANMQKNWDEVIKNGLELLKLNPWDGSTLHSMAKACEELDFEDSQIVYLKGALDANINDVEANRLLGRALASQGQFDVAIGCWNRVRQAKPADEEANRAIANLTAERTIHKGGYEHAETSTEVMADKQAQAERQGTASSRLTPEQQLEKAIAKDPANVSKYLELTQIHLRNDRFEPAEEVLTRALAASGGDISIREQLEDVQLRRAAEQVHIAEKKAAAEKTPDSQALWQQLKADLNNKELEIYRSRCDRYPTHLGYKYQLAVRLQRAKNYNEAIKVYQEARADTKRKGAVLYGLGGCFESIKQYKLAMNNYEQALAEISERDVEQRKQALHKTGVLAMALKDWTTAEKHLTELAGLDFGYKVVSDRLDKLARLREDGESS